VKYSQSHNKLCEGQKANVHSVDIEKENKSDSKYLMSQTNPSKPKQKQFKKSKFQKSHSSHKGF
jgi:hypothetical protein